MDLFIQVISSALACFSNNNNTQSFVLYICLMQNILYNIENFLRTTYLITVLAFYYLQCPISLHMHYHSILIEFS